jgi:hypothetical protein
MQRGLLAAIIALTLIPAASDACCDLDRPAAGPKGPALLIFVTAQAATADPSCPLHAPGGSGSTAPRPQPTSPVRCMHDLSVERAGLVKTVTAAAPDVAIATLAAPAQARIVVFTSLSPVAPQHAPPHRGSRPDVLRI